MRYYPVSLDIAEKKCLVVGGGSVGTRKVKTMLKCSAIVSVVSKAFTEELQILSKTEDLELISRPYNESDLDGKYIVISSTNDQSLNQKIADDARRKRIFCNIADLPDRSDFILPSIVHRGDLTISISTSGNSPAFSKKLRKELEEQFGEEYSRFLKLMGAARKKLLNTSHAPAAHKVLFRQLLDGDLLELTRQKDIKNIDALLKKTLGKGFSFKELMEG